MTNQSNKETKCPSCQSLSIKKRGFRKTQNRGKIQRFFCLSCKKSFVLDDGFFRMRNTPQKITCALDLFYRGVSTRKVQEHFQAFMPHNSSHKSIYKWVIKYAKMISSFTDSLKLKVGHELQIDEQVHARLKDFNYFIDSIDTQTRFVVASRFYETRGQKEIGWVLNSAKQKTLDQFKIITSDGFTTYPKCVKKVFGYNNKLGKHNVVHKIVNGSKGDGFNVPIERFHNDVRDRTKIMRGFHGSVESADSILKGFVVFYNFIRKHQGINCSPYELACPMSLGVNKWLGLINLSKR